MVQEAIDGLTDQQLADLELQESGLVSGQNAGAIAYTPFAQRMNPQPAPAPEPEEPVALSEFQLNQLEEENYRRMDYVMTPQEFDQYWDRRDKEDREVGRFFEGLGQGAAGLIGMVPETGRELQGAMVGMVTDPVNQVQRNVQTGAEIIRKGGINLVQLFDWVGSKVDDLATGSKRAEAINAGIMDRLIADGKVTGNREQDEQIYQAALAEAREAGAYTPTLDQAREDKGKAYERYVREKALERDFANVSEFKTGEGQMSVPTSAGTYQITDEQPMPTISTLGSMVVDPLNALPLGAGALSKARVLRRIANLSEKPMLGAERVASGLADVAERVELGISTRLQDITGLTQKQQAALGAGVAGTAVYVDSATDGGGGITKAVLMAGAVMPALHYGSGLLRKVGSAAGGAATIVREAGVGGLGVARAEAASSLAGNAAVPERYRKFFTGYVDGTDSTLKRVAQDAGNPEALRRGARFADRMGATQVARAADDAVSGAVTAGIVGSPFAALQPDAERAGEVMGGILALGGVGGLAGGVARRAGTAADADIARMFADVQAVGGNVEAFARLPHATLDRLSAMQGVLAGKVDFVPLTGDEYRMNADIAQNGGEATAGVFLDRDANNRARVFINLDGKTATDAIAPHEIGHAILTSNILDGQPRNDLRNLVNQQYGPGGVESRGREYIARMVDADLRQGVTGEAPTVLTDAEMKAMDGGKTMDDIVADRAKDPAERDRLINERVEEFRQRSIDKGEDALDWARDEIIAETFASEAPAIDVRAIRRDALFPRLAESMLSAGGRVLEVMGARLDPGTGKLMDSPSVLFRDNPLFQDRIMQKRVREYVRSYDQYLAGLEEAGAKELRGVELARSSKPEDLARSTHVKLRDEGNGVLENDFMVQRPDGTYTMKAQKTVSLTENARSAQIKTLYDARKFVPVNSQEFGKRKVNGREVVGGPVLPPQFDFFTNFPKHVREFARSMEQSRAEGGSWDIDYNAIGTGASGRYRVTNLGNVRAIQRETVPFGWQVTKANHLLAASLDLNAFRGSAMKAINKGDLGLFNNDMRQVEADLKTYLANHRNGRPGEMTIGQQKRDMLNGLIGTGTAVQRTANPLYSDLNPRGSIRTWRVDRLNDAKPTGRTGYFFDYDKINNNRMPSALPQAGMAMPDAAPVRTLDTDRLLREYEENQGYLGLSTMGMREGRPVKGGAAETRRLLARNTEINRELDARGVKTEDAQLQRALAKRQTGQAMPDATELWHGGNDIAQGDGPVFLGSKRMAQSYAKNKGGKLQKINASDLRFATAEEVERVLRDDGRISVPDTTMEPLFYTLDPAYSPARSKVAIEALQEVGYDGAILPIDSFADNPSNPSSSKKMEQSYMVFDRKSLQQPATGGTRGQAMPDAAVTQDGLVQAPEDAPTFKLPRRAMAQFMPDTGIRLEDYADRPIVALPADRMGIGQMRVGPKGSEQILSVPGQGGAGFMEIYNGGGWAFTDTPTADRFLGRLREVARPGDTSVIVGITALNEVNHLKNQTGQLAYVEALEAAIKNKSISRKQADAHIREIARRIYTSEASPKALTPSTKEKFKAMQGFDDFQKAVRAKSLNFADAAWLLKKMQQKALPLPYRDAQSIGIAFDDVARQTADPRYADVPFGTVVALLEVPINQSPSRNPFHYAYPAKVEGNRIGFLSKFQNIDDLTSDPRIRNKQGRVTAQPLQTVLPVMDRIGQRGQAMPDVADIDSSTSVGALQKHPMFKSAKYDGSAKAAFDIVESLVKPKAIQDVMSKIDPSRPAYIIPVIAREGDSANMLPLAMAEKLSAATGIPIWAKLAKTSSQHNTGAGADSRARTAHRWEGEPPPAGSQIVLVDDTYTTGQTLRSLASVVGDPDAVATISVGRYTKQFTLQPDREQKLLAKAGLTKQQFINLYGSEPKQALTGAQAQQYLLNGARGEQGLLARFPVERGGFSTQAIAGLTQLPEGVTTFSGGGLVEIGLRGIVRPTVAVEYSPAIAQAYRAAHGDHVKVQDIRTVSLEDHKGKFHYHASPVCKNSSLLKSAALGGGEKDLDIESAQAVARHIDQIEPKVVTIENVPDYAKTEAADIIRKKLQERGYMMDENVYNAAKFGAPTARRRYLLRAVKDGVLPEPVPQDGPGWYSTVADLIETLPDDSIARAQYIYRSLREQGVDPNNVTEPLLVSGTTLFKKVAFARPDQPAFTFKATPATVDRILLPGGRVKRVTARAKARMTGIPDDYPLPKDEKTALTIIGNGVPPALVRNVFGPVIEANK